MERIPKGVSIFLWFEEDLFCQLNCWFLMHLLKDKLDHMFLVRPKIYAPYSFGHLSEETLMSCFQEAIPLAQYTPLLSLWRYYQLGAWDKLMLCGKELKDMPFIAKAIQMHIDRLPNESNLGLPKETLRTIIKDLNTRSFGPIFQEFCKRLPQYGFGDLQVKRLLDELLRDIESV